MALQHRQTMTVEEYFHPDVTVTCDPRDRGPGDLLPSPRLVVEVLSPGTELQDRTWKLQNYTAHPTIEDYLLVSGRSLKMELYPVYGRTPLRYCWRIDLRHSSWRHMRTQSEHDF